LVTHQDCLVLDRVRSKYISGDFNRCTNDNNEEVPCTILDDGKIKQGDKYEAIYNAPDNGEGKGWVVHPNAHFVSHVGK
jgi:hypothetical protein